MFYNKEFNKYVVEGTAFELGGVQYPAVWLNQATPSQKSAIDLVEVVATNSPADERFYWVSSTLNEAELTYINTPKQLDDSEEPDQSGKLVKTIGLKTTWTAQVNDMAYSILFPSDWMVNKAIETEIAMPADWKAYRANVRSVADSTKTAIAACTTVDEFASVVTSIQWPHDPNYVPPVEEVTPPVVE
jgi:hypothetical protein